MSSKLALFLNIIFSPASVVARGAAGKTLAVPYEHDPAFHMTSSSSSPKHNDSPDLARSSTEKLQSHIVSSLTAIFTLPSLHQYFFSFTRVHASGGETGQTTLGLLQL